MRKNKCKILIFCIIIITTTILCIAKWNTWFGKIHEAEYAVSKNTIDRILMSMGEDSDRSRSFSWRSDSIIRKNILVIREIGSSDSIVIVAKGKKISTQGGVSVIYRADVDNLNIGSEYDYYISNMHNTSNKYRIQMPDKGNKFSFIYLGDIQDRKLGTSDSTINHIHNSYPEANFWAFGGDMIERPTDKYWNIWFQSVDCIAKTTPIIACTGNHEYFKGVVKKLDKRWIHHFPLPKNGPKNFKGRSCFWKQKDALIVSLDTDGVSGIFSLHEQYTWLEKVLKENTAKWKILIMHHPVYSLRKSRLNIPSKYFFNNLFKKYSVDLVLQGHDHAYSRVINKDDSGKLTTPVYVISSCSSKFYNPSEFDKWDRMSTCRKMYQYIEINEDILNYKSYDCATGYYDGVKIDKIKGMIWEDKNLCAENISLKEKKERENRTKIYLSSIN